MTVFAPAFGLAAPAPPIPASAFARVPDMAAPVISPGGRRIAYIGATDAGEPVVVVRDLETSDVRPVMAGAVGAFRVTRCDFKGEERLLCRFYATLRELGTPMWVSRLVSVDIASRKSKVLVQNGRSTEAQFQDRIVHGLPDDPRHVLIALDDDGNVFPAVFRLDVVDGGLLRVQREYSPVMSWLADRRGVVRFGYGYREEKALYIARDREDAEWRTLLRFRRFDSTAFHPVGFGATPSSLLVVAPHNGREAIWDMDLSEKADFQLIFSHPDVDVSSPIVWTDDGRVVGFAYHTDRPQQYFIDPEAAAIQKAIDAVRPGQINIVNGASRDRRRFLVESMADVAPPSFHVLDLDRRSLLAVGVANRRLAGATLAPMQTVRIAGSSGPEIPGYLTVPAGRDARGLAAIVLPHGGPYARDTWGYDELVQLLANRGYAVLQLNFRGSTGYGTGWFAAGFQHWGTVMHEDITAGAKWLLAQGVADPTRICIVGWSYGGYAALLGAVKEPTLYRCAVSIAGVSDPIRLQHDLAAFYGGRAAARESTGTDAAGLAAVSPLRNAARVSVPVLLVHGQDDVQARVEHSRNMARALESAGKVHELVVIEDGDHSLSRPEWRLELYTRLERFLASHLGATAPAAQ